MRTQCRRGMHQRELDELIAHGRAQVARRTTRHDDEHGVPAGLIYRAPDMLADPHFEAREAIVSVPHPELGELKMQNFAPRLSVTPGGVHSPSPRLGEHNAEIYLDLLGLAPEEYRELAARQII